MMQWLAATYVLSHTVKPESNIVMHKRKHRKTIRDDNRDQSAHSSYNIQPTSNADSSDVSAPDPCLYIQAHEADIIRGPSSTRSLEYDPSMVNPGHNSSSALIRWGPERPYDTDTIGPHGSSEPFLWVDR